MIAYREFSTEQISWVTELYENAGWTAYLGDSEKLVRAFRNSLFLLGAFDGQTLIGFIRCVGDGEHILYVQDLLVDRAHRRQGVGRTLLDRAMERYAGVRMFALATDAASQDGNAFYAAMGLRRFEAAGIVGYLR